MHQRRLGKTNLMISEVGLGALEMGAKYGIGDDAGNIPSEEEAMDLMRAAVDAGVTFFDSAGVYALSETRIGKFLKTAKQRPIIATKLMVSAGPEGQWMDYATERPYPSVEACVDHQVRRSMRNLGVETIDLMQLHGAPSGLSDRMTSALRRHVEAGRVRFLGASCGGADIPRLAAAGYSTAQVACSLLDQRELDAALPLAKEHDFGILVRIPLALGVLAGRIEHVRGPDERRRRYEPLLRDLQARVPGMPLPEAALRFLLSSPGITCTLTGTRRPGHIRANAAAGDGKGLPADVFTWLRGLAQSGQLPAWSWSEHYQNDWPAKSHEANLALCRSVDIPA